MKNILSRFPAIILLVSLFFPICSQSSASKAPQNSAPRDLSTLLSNHRGKVLILLLGMDGCPGTAKATDDLDQFIATKPGKVSVVRLDVPLPGKTIKPTSEWRHSFPRFVDTNRKIADKLEFFYYPTLYVFDGQGQKRYIGGFDKDKIGVMVREILAEKPGDTKKIYTLPMPAVGDQSPAFSGSTLSGEEVSVASLMGKRGLLLIFARTSCQFSAAEMPQFKDVAGRFRSEGVNTVIINQQEALETIKPIYEKDCPGVTVVWDRDGTVCKAFGVDAVPFFFLMNESGKIVNRRSFTHGAAVNSVNAMLGLEAEKQRFKPTEGG